jgi:hypothetical protein
MRFLSVFKGEESGPASPKTREDGRITVTDGPFTESKEVIGGFAMIQATNKEEVAGDGESEIRQLHEAPALQQ